MRKFIVLLLSITPAPASAEWELNMPVGVTTISEAAYDLHMLILWITVVIGIVVFGAMIYSIIYHRKSKGAQPANFYESTKIELEILYPKLVSGGFLIIDDYGHFKGCRKAVDEYFRDDLPYLHYVDYSCRLIIKS